MSKILKISKHKLDLARVELTGPSLLIGRSPMCDQVLRAPGIKPVHFLLEWVGEGEFNPSVGMWTLFDMGHLVSGRDEKNLAAEGIVIDSEQQYLGYNWSIVEDRFISTHIQRGIISNQLMVSVKKKNVGESKKLALEVVCLSQKEQKVQEIWHFFDQKIVNKKSSKAIPFALKWNQNDQVQIEFGLKPLAIFNLKGQRIDIEQTLSLSPSETLIIHFADEIYFIRFINRVEYQPNAFHFFQNKFWMVNLASLIFFCVMLWGIKQSPTSLTDVDSKALVRVVKIIEPENIEENKIIPVVEPLKKIEEEEVSVADKAAPLPPKEILLPEAKKAKASTAQAANYKSLSKKESAGLNGPARISDVNTVGLLGKVKSKGGASLNHQISAEMINQTFVDNTASGNDQKGILIPTSQMGVVGVQKNLGTLKGSDSGGNLMEAQTTLQGARDFSASSKGPLAHARGLKNVNTIGTGAGSVASSTLGTRSMVANTSSSPSGSMEVTGGLTKGQVYAVINAHRREIRTCFESALLVRNDLNGTLRLSFGVNIEGYVTEIKVVNTEIESSILETCVTQIIRQMVFPETPNQLPSTVIYPFVFKRVK